MTINEVAGWRADAELLHGALHRHPFSADESLLALRDAVARQAVEVMGQADEPITVGVVGGYSVGKSMLLGCLLGRPDLLPTEQRATTGNVTALLLTPGRPGEGTRREDTAAVTYLSEDEFRACVGHMLATLVREVRVVFPDADTGTIQDYDPLAQGWEPLEDWCREHLWAAAEGNPEHRKIAHELLTLRDAHLSAGGLLGRTLSLPADFDRDSIDLGDDEPVPGLFPRRSVRPVTRQAAENGGEELRVTFPLVKRVSYRVRVDPAVWPLDGLRDRNEVVLLDFPGLTARRSALRDEYLSSHELRHVHTIIVVIDAERPSTDVPDKFYSMLQRHKLGPGAEREPELDMELMRDYILVAGNRFDLVLPPDPEGTGPLDSRRLRESSQNLRGLWNTALGLVQKRTDRILLTSGPVAMARTGLNGVFLGEEGKQVKAAMSGAGKCADAWRPIAGRMAAADPGDPLFRALDGFSRDGGMDGLRGLLESHVRDHGLKNKTETVRQCHRRMCSDMLRLKRLLESGERGEDADEEARRALTELFGSFRSHHQSLMASLETLRDSRSLVTSEQRPLLEQLRASMISEVMRWSEWQTVLSRVQGGYVKKSRPRRRSTAAWGLDEVIGSDERGNETTGTFLGPYRATFQSAVHHGRTELAKALSHWFEERNAELQPLRDRLEQEETARSLDLGLPRYDQGRADTRRRLALLADLSWMVERIPVLLRSLPADDLVERSYPLHVDRALPWHRSLPEPEDIVQRLARHQFYLIRLQRELVNGLVTGVDAQLFQDLDWIFTELQEILLGLSESIPDSAAARLMFPPRRPREQEDAAPPPPADPPSDGEPSLLDVIKELENRRWT